MGKNKKQEKSAVIPKSLKDPILVLSTQDIDNNNKVLTVFIGIITSTYLENNWNAQKEHIKELFLADNEMCVEVKVRPQEDLTNQVNSDSLENNIYDAVTKLNSLNVDIVRIVLLGDSWSRVIDGSVKNLLIGWDHDFSSKIVQFVATSAGNDKLHYCKRLCLMKICSTIQYCHTADYNKWGNLTLTEVADDIDVLSLLMTILLHFVSIKKLKVGGIVLFVLLCGFLFLSANTMHFVNLFLYFSKLSQ
jgi:hypothetical protein